MFKFIYFLFLLATLLLGSCNVKYYSPNTHNVPLLREKGEFKTSFSGDFDHAELQGAVAVTNNLGIQANATFFNPNIESRPRQSNGRLFEIGPGLQIPLKNDFIFELYTLYGAGSLVNDFSINNQWDNEFGVLNADIQKLSLQPSIGLRVPRMAGAISFRFAQVTYRNVVGDLMTFDNFEGIQVDEIMRLTNNDTYYLIEPAFTYQVGSAKGFKFQVQLSGSYNITEPQFDQDNIYASVGVIYHLSKDRDRPLKAKVPEVIIQETEEEQNLEKRNRLDAERRKNERELKKKRKRRKKRR